MIWLVSPGERGTLVTTSIAGAVSEGGWLGFDPPQSSGWWPWCTRYSLAVGQYRLRQAVNEWQRRVANAQALLWWQRGQAQQTATQRANRADSTAATVLRRVNIPFFAARHQREHNEPSRRTRLALVRHSNRYQVGGFCCDVVSPCDPADPVFGNA